MRRFLHIFIRGVRNCGRLCSALSGVFMVLIVVLITVEIILRTVFNTSTLIADEYSAYFFVAVVMLGLSRTLDDGAHIRITLILGRMPPMLKKTTETAAYLLGIGLCTFTLYHAAMMVWDARTLEMTADSISETPIWMPQLMIPVGLLFFDLQLLAGLAGLFAGDEAPEGVLNETGDK